MDLPKDGKGDLRAAARRATAENALLAVLGGTAKRQPNDFARSEKTRRKFGQCRLLAVPPAFFAKKFEAGGAPGIDKIPIA